MCQRLDCHAKMKTQEIVSLQPDDVMDTGTSLELVVTDGTLGAELVAFMQKPGSFLLGVNDQPIQDLFQQSRRKQSQKFATKDAVKLIQTLRGVSSKEKRTGRITLDFNCWSFYGGVKLEDLARSTAPPPPSPTQQQASTDLDAFINSVVIDVAADVNDDAPSQMPASLESEMGNFGADDANDGSSVPPVVTADHGQSHGAYKTMRSFNDCDLGSYGYSDKLFAMGMSSADSDKCTDNLLTSPQVAMQKVSCLR